MECPLDFTINSLSCGESFYCVRAIQRLVEKYPGTVRFDVEVHDYAMVRKAMDMGIYIHDLGNENYSLMLTAEQRANFLAGVSKGFNLYYELSENELGCVEVDRLKLSLVKMGDSNVAVIKGISLIADYGKNC